MLSFKDSIQLDQIHQEKLQDIQEINYLIQRLKHELNEARRTIVQIDSLLSEIVN